MPQKRRRDDNAKSMTEGDADGRTPPKRQRVSLACDTCRVVRERCDGVRPFCGTCSSLGRSCSYTPTLKKRGVQTGYLRTIELSLAWLLFEESPGSEDALCRLLSSKSGVLQKKGKPADRLHKKWGKSRVNKEIGRLLSEDCPDNSSKIEASAEDSNTEDDEEGASATESNCLDANKNSPSIPRPMRNSEQLQSYALTLPDNWRRLVDVYFSYTHCWLPILNKAEVLDSATTYPVDGISMPPRHCDIDPRHAELWAVLALSSFQDAASSNDSWTDDMPPAKMYALARDLVPDDVERLGLPHLRSLILHSLVLIGRGAALSAWVTVGTATRLALHLRGTGGLLANGSQRDDSTASVVGILSLAACLALDSCTSACLGQSPSCKDHFGEVLGAIDTLVESEPAEAWAAIPGFGAASQQSTASPATTTTQPLRTFRQLLRFSHILSMGMGMDSTPGSSLQTPASGAEGLAKSLDPAYSFCNSVILGGSTPAVPSAFLLQTAFLAITTSLVHSQRVSLLSSLLEVVESCAATFGPWGTPPIITGFLGMVQRCGQLAKMHETEREKWEATLASMKQVWEPPVQDTPAASSDAIGPYSTAMAPKTQAPPLGGGLDSQHGMGYMHDDLSVPAPGRLGSQPDELGYPRLAATHPGADYSLPRVHGQRAGSQGFSVPAQGKDSIPGRPIPLVSTGPPFQPLGAMKGTPAMLNGANEFTNQSTDYGALLEELGSIDCAEGLESDPQFMTNLGFAPGCDMGEMFQGADFGV